MESRLGLIQQLAYLRVISGSPASSTAISGRRSTLCAADFNRELWTPWAHLSTIRTALSTVYCKLRGLRCLVSICLGAVSYCAYRRLPSTGTFSHVSASLPYKEQQREVVPWLARQARYRPTAYQRINLLAAQESTISVSMCFAITD